MKLIDTFTQVELEEALLKRKADNHRLHTPKQVTLHTMIEAFNKANLTAYINQHSLVEISHHTVFQYFLIELGFKISEEG